MKVNIPERLYLSKNIYGTYLYQVPDPDDETAVEYTRTDAFIEKAAKWLEENGCGYWLDDSALPNRDLIEDFRKYMEE